jgi:two-component system NarL family sensor kinase
MEQPTSDDVRVEELTRTPELYEILVAHAYRGVWVQFLLRTVLLVFMVAVIGFVPPAHDRSACYVLVAGYAVWAAGVAVWTRRGGVAPVRWMWVALIVDALALGALTLIAGASAEQSWTADLLVNGLFIMPMLAATQLRPIVCAAVTIPTTAIYLASSLATESANTEPVASVLLRTFVLAGLGVGCFALSRVQLSRVLTVAGLARDRAGLLTELMSVESRERTRLAEQLHDGALQFVLAARQDIEDARDSGDPAAFDRLEYALNQSATLLRSTVTQLHPAVLHAAGLTRAVQDLAATEAERTHTSIAVDLSDWALAGTDLDELLFTTARELLVNVAKHARASSVQVTLSSTDDRAQLVVADNGRGLAATDLTTRVAEGHVGLASLRTRVAGAGGTIRFAPAQPSGTIVTVDVPVRTPAEPAVAPAAR